MKRYYLKLTALTPIHIGTGEVYEPTNFVIDNGYLYEFDEVLFYKSLSENKQKDFNEIVQMQTENGYELFEKIHKFILNNKLTAIKVAYSKVKVSKKFQTKYISDIARKVQTENFGNKSVFNKLNPLKNSHINHLKQEIR